MAVLGRLLVSSAERLDLPDLLSLDSYAAGDWRYFLKGLVGDTKPFILKGFDVIDPGNAIGTQSCSIRVADSITWYPGSNSGSFFHGLQEGHPQAAPLVPELRKNAVNYVYLTFSTFNTSVDTRAFWDPDKDGGVGGEFTQDVNTESVLKVDVNVSTGSFPANTVPVAKITVGPVVITAIEDARDLMFRLGSGGINPNPFNTYAWRSLPGSQYARQEPPTQMLAGGVNPFQGADKNILTLKEWMDAVMSKLRELGGTTYWYDDTSSFSIITNFYDAVATAFKSKGKWVHDTVTPGLLTWTEDIQIKMTSDPRTYIIRQGSVQLQNEEVMYIPMERNQLFNPTDESVSWTNGQLYVNTVGGAVGLFANLSKGDYIKKANDTIDKWVRVEEFYDAVNNGGSTTTAAGARSVRIGSPYLGSTGVEKGRYDKGVYTAGELTVSSRDDAAIANTGGNFHWLALRSDTIENIGSVVTTDLSIAIDQHDGSTARVTSVAHGLVDGDRVTIAGTTNYDGTYQVEVETSDIFYINVSGGPFADESGTAHYALVTTVARTTLYGFQEESANHGFNTDDTIQIDGTTNYDGSYKVNVRSATTFTIATPGPAATENAGTATLAKIIVRTEGAVAQLIQGQVIDIGGSIADNIRLYVGMESLSQTAPNYQIPPDYNTLDGMQNYNGTVGDNLTIRVAKLTAMMADKAQDKTLQFLPSSGITEITNTENGAAQELRFVPDGSSLTIVTPSSDGQTFLALPGSGSPISLLENQCAYIVIDRNNPSTVTWTIADIVDVPLEENVLIVATRINTPEIYIWDATLVPSGSIPPPDFLSTIVNQNNTIKMVRGGTWSWGGAGTTPANFAVSPFGLSAIDFVGASTIQRYGQRFQATQTGDITSMEFHLNGQGGTPGGLLYAEIYSDVGGFPGVLLGTSDQMDATGLYQGSLPYPAFPITFSTPPVSGIVAGNFYHVILRTELYTGSLIEFMGSSANQYANGYVVFTNNSGVSWSDLSPEDYNFSVDGTIAAASDTLTWDADAYISVAGLTEGRNTIPADSITLANDGEVAWVSINRLPGADDNLTINIDQVEDVPLGASTVVIARRTGTDVIVGAHSMLLVPGESKKLYAGMSDENMAYIGAANEADNSPDYSSNTYVSDGDSLTAAIGKLDLRATNLSWKDPVADAAALPPTGNSDGDVRLTLDTRIVYTWHNATTEWLPINGTGGGTKILGGGTLTWVAPNLTFTSDMFLELKGLSYADNTISTASSPIALSAAGQVAWVIPNLNTGGPTLTVSTGALTAVPANALIIARREVNDVIFGSSSTRLKNGQSSELYAQESIQSRNTLRSTDFLRSDNPVTWTGTQLQFTTDIVLETLNVRTGANNQYTIVAADSPIALTNGQVAYLIIDRAGAGGATSVVIGSSVPTMTSETFDYVMIGKRVDALGAGYLHIPLHKQVLEPGQTVRLGASGSGGSKIKVTAGENLTAGEAVYISKGSANGDIGRTLGQAYKLDASNDNRMEFVGIVELTVTSGNDASIQTSGEMSGFVGLIAGVPLWADYTTPGDYTQTAPSASGNWLVPLGVATSSTKILVNAAGAATAIFLEATSTGFTVANNTANQNVIGLAMSGAATRALKVSFSLRRKTDTALSEVVQVGEMRIWYNTQAATYNILTNYSGDDCGATFTITAGGQVQVSTTNIAGTNYVGEMRFTAEQFALGV